jgi:hypothetical protein
VYWQFILAGDSDSDFEEDPRVTRDTARAGEELARAMEVGLKVYTAWQCACTFSSRLPAQMDIVPTLPYDMV